MSTTDSNRPTHNHPNAARRQAHGIVAGLLEAALSGGVPADDPQVVEALREIAAEHRRRELPGRRRST